MAPDEAGSAALGDDDPTVPSDAGAHEDATFLHNDGSASGGPGGRGLRGRRIGAYTLLKELGHGGQGFVWLAEDTRLRRKVALKMLTSQAAMSEKTRLRFLREAEVASRLSHPGICGVYEFGQDDGIHYIAMPYIEGVAFDRRIRENRVAQASCATISYVDFEALEEEPDSGGVTGDTSSTAPSRRDVMDVVRFIEDTARALHAAHEAGLVHRDIKPGNIMVRSDGSPVILDFGLARDDSERGEELTQTGDLFGTPAYMSPEQLTARRVDVDRRSDVYSLAVTLFEGLTLRRPFEALSREALYQAILTEEPPRVRQLNPAVPRDLEVVVACALEKDRERRYQTALDFAEELERVLEHQPIAARPAGAWTRTVRWAQRNPAVTALLVVVFAALGTTGGVFAWKNRDIRHANTLLASTIADLEQTNADLERKTDEAAENAERAEKEAAEKSVALEQVRVEKEQARHERDRAQRERDRVTRLKDRRILRRMRERADGLFPAEPDLIGDLEEWLDDAKNLLARLPLHRESLAALEAKAGPYDDIQRSRDHPDAWPRLLAARTRLAELDEALGEADSEAAEQRLEAEADRLDEELSELERQVAVRESWGFDDEEAWLHDLLRDLVRELQAFEAEGGLVAEIGARLATAREIGPRTLEDHAESWNATSVRVRTSEKYGGLELAPQLGLIPLGPDAATGFEEFLHWQSHARGARLPERNAEGRFEVTAETGIILVLLPGGTYHMGSQGEDPAKPNHDPQLDPGTSPAHEVTLSPFFIGKHEVTRGQFVRISGRADPSNWNPVNSGGLLEPEVLPRLPVERVDWFTCEETARRVGLVLPTEARWEYACRGGSDEIYFFGDDPARLPGFANVRDRQWARAMKDPQGAAFDDGHALVAPSGSFEPNAFGLHDVCGNVLEWCSDWFDPEEYGRRREGCSDPTGPESGSRRVLRGGSWNGSPWICRSSARNRYAPSSQVSDVGFRVSRNPN